MGKPALTGSAPCPRVCGGPIAESWDWEDSCSLFGKVMGSLADGLSFADKHVGERPMSCAAGEPDFDYLLCRLCRAIGMVTAVPGPRTTMVWGLAAAILRDQRILTVGERKISKVHAFRFPLICKDDYQIGVVGELGGGIGIGAGIEGNFGVRQFVAQRRKRRSGKPDVIPAILVALFMREA